MPSKSLKLHIPEPCHEDWQQMVPNEKGRHCLACQKTVIDFTRLSDKEIINFFAHKPASVCGRFRPEQLNPRIIENPQPMSRWKLYALAFTATMTMKTIFSETIKAQAPTEQRETKKNSTVTGMSVVEPFIPNYTISGQVMDSNSHEVLEGVSILIKGTNTATATDAQGKFRLENVKQGDVLVFWYIGYENKEAISISGQPLLVTLTPDMRELTGDVVVTYTGPLYKRTYYRIKHWIRSHF